MARRSIQLRPRALDDLETIYQYSLEQWGITRAEAYLTEINKAFEALANHPNLGRDYSRVRADLYAFNIAAHVIFYSPTPTGILVSRVLHKSMDHVRHL